MKKYSNYYYPLFTFYFFLLAAIPLTAQTGLVIEQKETTFDENILYDLDPENADLEDAAKRISLFLDADINKLALIAQETGQELRMEKSTMYILEDKFRVDIESPDEKMTIIFKTNSNTMYHIDWNANTVTEISLEQIKKMRKETEGMASQMKKNMPDIEKMLENLPPEQREKALEAMKKSGYNSSAVISEEVKPTVEKTGRKMNIYNFTNCEEYRILDGDKTIVLWATKQNPALTKQFHNAVNTFKDNFNFSDEDDDEPWELVEDTFPVLIKTYEENMMMGSMELTIQEFLSAKETNIPPGTFEEHKNPKLIKRSIMEMMNMDPKK